MPTFDMTQLTMITEAERKAMVGKSVVDGSRKTYASTLKTLKTMVFHLRKNLAEKRKTQSFENVGVAEDISIYSISKMEFLSVCKALIEKNMGTAPMMIAALKKAIATDGKSDEAISWLHDRDIGCSVKAVAKTKKSKTLPCGTLTFAQYEQLLEYLSREKEYELVAAVTIAYAARLRIGELMGLQEADFIDADPVGFVFLRQQKQGDEDVTPLPKLIPRSTVTLAQRLGDRKARNGCLFSAGIDARLRDGMMQWGPLLGWSSALRWSGPHVFRHAGTNQIRDTMTTRIGEAVLAIFAQQSKGMVSHYGMNAGERIAAAAGRKRARNE